MSYERGDGGSERGGHSPRAAQLIRHGAPDSDRDVRQTVNSNKYCPRHSGPPWQDLLPRRVFPGAPTARHHPRTPLGDFSARELHKASGSGNRLLFTKSSRARGDLGPHCKPQAPPRCAERARSCGPQRPKTQAEFPPQEPATASHPAGDPENVGLCGYINHLLRLNLKPGTVSNTGTQCPASIGSTHLTRTSLPA